MQQRSNKRQKEMARLERQKEKDARRDQRKKEKSEAPAKTEGGVDKDIEGIIPGPQPILTE